MKNKIEQKHKEESIKKPKILVILGPTASGKTGLAVQLAKEFNGEIVSADARQVYQGLDIGTSKDLAEYWVNGQLIPFHLIDVVDPKENFDLAQYQKLAFAAINDILSRKKLPILCGGSGLYLQAIIDNYQLNEIKPDLELRKELEAKTTPQLLEEIKKLDQKLFTSLNDSEKNNQRRLIRHLEVLKSRKNNKDKNIEKQEETSKENEENKINQKGERLFNPLIIGLSWPITELRQRIKTKLLLGLEQGMVKEVQDLHAQGLSWKRLDSLGLEYRYIAKYLQGELKYDEMVEQLNLAIGQFAKRQLSWFKRWEKQGIKIDWIENIKENKNNQEKNIKKEAIQLLSDFLSRK